MATVVAIESTAASSDAKTVSATDVKSNETESKPTDPKPTHAKLKKAVDLIDKTQQSNFLQSYSI